MDFYDLPAALGAKLNVLLAFDINFFILRPSLSYIYSLLTCASSCLEAAFSRAYSLDLSAPS
jgi:hypothetical protein